MSERVEKTCGGCGKITTIENPDSLQRTCVIYCDEECWELYLKNNPEKAKGWKMVNALTPLERAELDMILGKGAKA